MVLVPSKVVQVQGVLTYGKEGMLNRVYRADAYIAELDEVTQRQAVMTNRETDGFIDHASSHRHDPVEKS